MSDLSLESLLETLKEAGSQHDRGVREAGEKKLKSWQNVSGYHSGLQTIYLNTSCDQANRWLSIILLKNSIQSHWRKTSKYHMNDEEKGLIRGRIFDNLSEANRQLLVQNASTIAQIARIDFPREWGELFERIELVIDDAVSGNDLVKLYNILYVLNQVLKVLASVKFGRSKPAMQEKAGGLLRKVSPIYVSFMNEWGRGGENDLAKMEVGYLALKVSSRLMYDGHEYVNRSGEAEEFFGVCIDHFKTFLSVYETPDYGNFPLLSKYVKQMGKLFLRVYDKQATSFVLVNRSSEVLESYLGVILNKASFLYEGGGSEGEGEGDGNGGGNDDDGDNDERKEVYEKIVSQGLELFQGMIKVLDKSPATSVKGRTEQDRLEANQAREFLKTHIFIKEINSQLMGVLINWYFRLTYSDLENWNTDPEGFFIEESEQTISSNKIRPIAIGLYQTMLMAFKDELTSQVLRFIEDSINIQDSSLKSILIKDAALQAFENGSGVFGDVCDFNLMFKTILAPQGYVTSPPHFKILRRRLCLLLPEWIYRIQDQEILNEIYKLLCGFLNQQDPLNDLVVQLYTIQSLRFCVDTYEFKPDQFSSYIDVVFTSIFHLCNQVESIEAKNSLLNTLSVLFEQLGSYIIPYIDGVLTMLPPLWQDTTDNYLINGVILQTLTNIINAAREKSVSCYQMAIPAIRISVDPTSELYAYLLEDALPLWKALVENAETTNDDLLSLLPSLMNLLEKSTEELTTELDILKSYILLSPSILTTEFTNQLFTITAQYIPSMSKDSFSKLTDLLSLISLLSPLITYINPFFDSGLFNEILKTLFDDGIVTMITVCQILNIFSKMSFENASLFLQLLSSAGQTEKILSIWIQKSNHMGHPRDRKMNGLGLASLVSTGDPLILSKLPEIIDLWCQLIDEVSEEQGDSECYYGAFDYPHPQDQQPLSPEQIRLKQLTLKDPIHSISLKQAIQSSIKSLHTLPEHYKTQFIQPLDPKIISAMNLILE